MNVEISRRNFLKTSGAATSALVIGLNAKGVLASADLDTTGNLNPFVRIDDNGIVSVIIKHFEMGQGTTTGLSTLVAEELDADWETLKTEFAPAKQVYYKNLMFGSQGTGGSTAIANSFMQYREAGAMARDLLVRAAAQSWNVAPKDITIEKGILKSGTKSGSFKDFIAKARTLSPVEKPMIKTPDQFTLIGKMETPRKDSLAKTNGTAMFAMDLQVPGMVYVAIKRSPKFGGKLVGFEVAEAAQSGGFIDAKALPDMSGVAVYAKNTWAAFQARDLINATWDFSAAEQRSTDEMYAQQREQNENPTYDARKDVSRTVSQDGLKAADEIIETEFMLPYLSHAPMESLNCIIEALEDGGVLIHDGCQFPGITQPVVAGYLGLKPEQVHINTVYAGGSFGRRATPTSDYQMEAAMAFDLMGRQTPIKLVWSREDDIKGGYYRPQSVHKARIGLDKSGKVVGWDHRLSAKPILKGTIFNDFFVHDGVDHSSVEGITDTLYDLPTLSVGLSDFETPVPVLWWRAVGHTHTAFVMETLLDQVAEKSGKDPIALRLELLKGKGDKQDRYAKAIELVRDKSNWGQEKAKGQGLGFASHFSFNSYVGVVADVREVEEDTFHVENIHISIDCGLAINPDVIIAQMEGNVGYGLGAVMRNEITFTQGEVDQSNFPDYEPLRIGEMPNVHVHIVASNQSPTGVGEPGLPPLGPAVANALFDATKKRITQLPFVKSGLDFI